LQAILSKNSKTYFNQNDSFQNKAPRKPCSICVKAQRPMTLHPESKCWYNEKSENYRKFENKGNKGIKIANNTEFEQQLNSDSDIPKN